MSNLTDFFGKGASRVTGKAAHSQPAFVVVGGNGGSYLKAIVYDHSLKSLGSYESPMTNKSEFSSYSSWNYNTNPSTQDGLISGHGISKNGYLGNPAGYTTKEAFEPMVSYDRGINPARETHYSYGVVPTAMVGTNPGIKQNYAIGTSHIYGIGAAAFIRSCPRSNRRIIRNFDGNNVGGAIGNENDLVYVQTVGMLTSGYRLAAGGFSYNQNSGNAVILERDNSSTSTQWRPVLIKNFPDPGKYVSDQKAWGAAITAITAVSANRVVGPGTSSSGRDAVGNNITKALLCDNNDVLTMGSTASGVQVRRWRWNSGNNTWDAPTAADRDWTTKYHHDTNSSHPNWCMSLDGKTAVLMSHSYYYMVGYYLTIIDVATGNAHNYYHSQSSGSYSIVPIGASEFLFSYGANSDGEAGMYATVISWDKIQYDATPDHFTAHSNHPAHMTPTYRFIDAPYNSTNYPTICPLIDVDNESIVLAEKGEL